MSETQMKIIDGGWTLHETGGLPEKLQFHMDLEVSCLHPQFTEILNRIHGEGLTDEELEVNLVLDSYIRVCEWCGYRQ